jgi:Predicted periplasmic protein
MIKQIVLVLLLFSSLAQADDMVYSVKSVTDVGNSDYTVVILNGALGNGVAQAVIAEFQKASTQKILFELNSEGGLNSESDQIIAAMNELRAQGKQVDTFVANGSKCASACTLLFISGDRRIAAATAAFMFHAVQYRSVPGAANSFQTTLIVKYYIEHGMSSAWIKEQMKLGVFTGVNEVWISAKESQEIKLGLVTELWSNIVQHKPAPIDPQIRPR